MPAGVIVPVHGFAPYLAEALDSVLAQEPAAVVVVDDGSPLPLALHPDHAPHVTLVRRDAPGGPAVARGAGLRVLGGAIDLVALCDADDAWEPGKLAAQLDALAAEPGAGWCFGRARIVGPDGRETGERWAEPAPGRHPAAALARDLYTANPVPTSSVLVRRAALDDAGGFPGPVRVAEDWELWLRLARAGHDALCVPDAVVRYRRHPEGLTADVAGLARAQHAVHAAHADLVDAATRRAAQAADRRALRRERLRRAARAIPGTRAVSRPRDPYRR